MSRVFITGSSDGLGLMAGQVLAEQGHAVTLHARNASRAADTRAALPAAENVLVGDLSSLAGMREVAAQANDCGRFDAVIHNAGVGYREVNRAGTADGLAAVFAVNVLAAYLLTALIKRPDRLIYLGSGMHRGGHADLGDAQWVRRRWNGPQAYSDSKLFDVTLAFAVARRWPTVRSNAVDPGWVPTKMGGSGAPDDLAQGSVTQAWLAVSEDPAALVSGAYFYHQRPRQANPAVTDTGFQDKLLAYCAELAGAGLAGAELAGAELAGPDLAGAELAGAELAGPDLAGAELAGPELAP